MPAPLLAALVLLTAAQTPAQASAKAARAPSARELGGFLLGQYAKTVEAKLGKPARTGTDDQDGETLWHYDLAPNEGTVLTFSITKDEVPLISMIKLTGAAKPGLYGLNGVTLGDTKARAIERLGAPDSTEAKKLSPGERLDWEDRNFLIGISPEGRVDTLQIVDNTELYPEPGDTKPDLAAFQRALEARDREAILGFLCADIDVYTKTDDTVNFAGSPREDVFNEESLIARYVYGGTGSTRDLLSATLAASAALEENDYDKEKWSSNFPEDSPLSQIVWAFEAGRWRVWEIHLDAEEKISKSVR